MIKNLRTDLPEMFERMWASEWLRAMRRREGFEMKGKDEGWVMVTQAIGKTFEDTEGRPVAFHVPGYDPGEGVPMDEPVLHYYREVSGVMAGDPIFRKAVDKREDPGPGKAEELGPPRLTEDEVGKVKEFMESPEGSPKPLTAGHVMIAEMADKALGKTLERWEQALHDIEVLQGEVLRMRNLIDQSKKRWIEATTVDSEHRDDIDILQDDSHTLSVKINVLTERLNELEGPMKVYAADHGDGSLSIKILHDLIQKHREEDVEWSCSTDKDLLELKNNLMTHGKNIIDLEKKHADRLNDLEMAMGSVILGADFDTMVDARLVPLKARLTELEHPGSGKALGQAAQTERAVHRASQDILAGYDSLAVHVVSGTFLWAWSKMLDGKIGRMLLDEPFRAFKIVRGVLKETLTYGETWKPTELLHAKWTEEEWEVIDAGEWPEKV